MPKTLRKPANSLTKLAKVISLALLMCVAAQSWGQYQVITPQGRYIADQWTVPKGVDSIVVGLWGGGAPNGYANGQLSPSEPNLAGGGGAYTQSKTIPVTFDQLFYADPGGAGKNWVGSGYGDNLYSNPTTFGPFADGSYDTAYSGVYGTGGQASKTIAYVLLSYAGGNGAAGYGGSYYGGAGAAANFYGAGQSGTAATSAGNGNNGTGQSGAASGSYGEGYWYYDGFENTYGYNNNGLAPGGGGGSEYGGNATIRLGMHMPGSTQYKTAGTYSWTVPAGVSTIYVQTFGGGGYGTGTGGGGGGFTQSNPLSVSPGQVIQITVGAGGTSSNNTGLNSYITVNGNSYLIAYGGSNSAGGAASPTVYDGYQFYSMAGGNPGSAGGGAAANPFASGLPGSSSAGGVGYYYAGSGGYYSKGVWPGGGGGVNYAGADGAVIISYSCDASTYVANISNGHTVAYPPELVPDSVKLNSSLPSGSVLRYQWQHSKDLNNWDTATAKTSASSYIFSNDSIGATTYYRLGNNACYGSGYGNWSDTVTMKVLTSTNGRNGLITGSVITRNGSSVHGRKIFAQSLTPLKGRPAGFLDSVSTDNQGNFALDSVFYGDRLNGDSAAVRFLIYPDTSGNHKYSPANALLTLSSSNPSYSLQAFKDTTLLAITGQIYQVCTGCLDTIGNPGTIVSGVDSVRIMGIGNNNSNTTPERDSATTGGTSGNYGLNLQEPDIYTLTPSFHSHQFSPSTQQVNLVNNIAGINFNDTTTHMVSGYFTAGCRDTIGSVTLEFDDVLFDSLGQPRASELKKQVTTGAGGYYSLRLPARKYMVQLISGNIHDPVNPSLDFSTVLSFFGGLPADSVKANLTDADTVLNLVYKRAPQVQVSGIIDTIAIINCPTNPQYAIWPQGATKAASFDIYQGPISKGCLLNEGVVQLQTDIQNSIGKYDYDTINVVNGHAVINLKAGQPNTLINPSTGAYSKYFFATYTDAHGRSLTTDTLHPALPTIVVTGVSVDSSAQTFVTVTPQIPLMVLHDPPGNISYSEWQTGSSSQQTMSFSAQGSASDKVSEEIKVGEETIDGIGVAVDEKAFVQADNSVQTTATVATNGELSVATTTTNIIKTAANNNGIGSDGDVFYGAAMNIKYAVGSEIDYDSLQCTFTKKNVMVFAPTGLSTTFLYTLSEIRDVQIPKLQLAAQTKPDSAAYFLNQVKVWQQVLANNAANLQKAPIDSNISFSSQTSFTHTATLTNSSTNTYNFELEIDASTALKLGFEDAGSGANATDEVEFKLTAGGGLTNANTTETTTSYTLEDDNNNSLFSVNLKTDPVYGTPMFETVAGESTCPAEVNTIALDSMVLTTNTPIQKNLISDTANFTLFLGNLSIDPNAREYVVFLNASSNPDGATVLIGGTSAPDGVGYIVPNGGTQKLTVSVIRNTAGGVFNYDNLEIIASDNCFEPTTVSQFLLNNHQSSAVYLSADFTSTVSPVNLVTPANNWVANMSANNAVSIQFNGYDTTKLQTIALEYSAVGSSNWTTAFTDFKTSLGPSGTGTTTIWNITNVPDGAYNLRLVVQDKFNHIVYSQVATGLIDRVPPALFGTPQPSNGIYTAGSQIAFSYTQNIDGSKLTGSSVQMTDLTGNAIIPVQASAFANTLAIVPSINLIQITNGHNISVIVSGITDLDGNVKIKPDTSYFTVGSSIPGTGPDAVNVTIGVDSLFEDATGAMDVHFTRNSKAATPTVIYYTVAGTAVYNKDYTLTYSAAQTPITGITGTQGAVVLPKDSSSVVIYIHPVKDSLLASSKNLIINLGQGGGYSLGNNYMATATILNHPIAKPAITSFTPTSAAAGTIVTITGSGFKGATAVSFGGVPAASFTVVSATSIKATVSAFGTSGIVSVTTPAGTSTKGGFIFIPPVAPGSAMLFDGITQAVSVNTGTLTLTTGFTVEAWIRPASTATMTVLSSRSGKDYSFDITLNSGNTIHGDIGNGSSWLTQHADAPFAYNPGTWYHIAYAVSSAGYTIYANGDSIGAGNFSGTPLLCNPTRTISLGAQNNGTQFFSGDIDEVRVYSGALTKANIQADMRSTTLSVPANIRLYYNFDQPTGVDTLKDFSGRRYTGTITGSTPYVFVESYAMVVPKDTSATNITTTGFTANWMAPVTGIVNNYYLDVANDTAFSSIVPGYNQLSIAGTIQNVTGLTPGTKYYYRVRANKTSVAGQGAYGETISVSTAFGVPTITSFTPGNGASGTVVTITGTNFTGATAVSFGGTAAASFNVISSTSIQAVVGSGTSGSVSVTAPGGMATKAGFVYCIPVTPTASINANVASPICAKTKVTFSATAINGGTPVYQWYKNNAVVGGNTKNYADSLLNNNDSVWCVITSTASCVTTNTAKSNVMVYLVNSKLAPTLKVTINTPSTTICVGTSVTFTATATNTGANPTYQWKKNNVNVGTNSATYVDAALNNKDSVICVLTIAAPCATPASITSAKMKFTVNPIVAPSVTMTTNFPSPICAKTKVTFTATPVNAVTPAYQWYKNGKPVGTNAKNYVDSLIGNGNSIWCIITSSPGCITKDTAKSNVMHYVVYPKLSPTLKLTVNTTTTICAGTPVTFTATANNTGTNPIYQWKKNNVNVGANSTTYTDSTLNNNDSVVCVLTITAPCATPSGITSGKLRFTVASAVPPQPSTIKGLASVTAGQTNLSYGVTDIAGNTYNWTVPAGVSIVSGQGTYKLIVNWGSVTGIVSVKAVNGCGASTPSQLTVTVPGSVAGYDPKDALLSGGYIRAYPNPVTSMATIEFSATTTNKYEAQVMNSLGQLVVSKSGLTAPGLNTVSLDMSSLASTIYYVRLIDKEHGIRIIKLVKAK